MALLTDQFVGRTEELGSFDQVARRGRSGRSRPRSHSSGSPGSARPACSRSSRVLPTTGRLVLAGSAFGARARPAVLGLRGRARRVPARTRSRSPGRLGRGRAHGALAGLPVALCSRQLRAVSRFSTSATAVHRAVRALLEELAKTRSLVLVLDDVHWADSASVELLGALLRRPPSRARPHRPGRPPTSDWQSASLPQSNGPIARGRSGSELGALTVARSSAAPR